MSINEAVVIVIGAAACASDLRYRRIPNALTLGGAAAAVLAAVAAHGAGGLATSAGGWLTGVALFLPFFALGGMGAGDVKLLGCFGAWLGAGVTLWVGLDAAIAGGVMAVALALATGYLGEALLNLSALAAHWRKTGLTPLARVTLDGTRGPRLPYALPITAGAVAAIWLR